MHTKFIIHIYKKDLKPFTQIHFTTITFIAFVQKLKKETNAINTSLTSQRPN